MLPLDILARLLYIMFKPPMFITLLIWVNIKTLKNKETSNKIY